MGGKEVGKDEHGKKMSFLVHCCGTNINSHHKHKLLLIIDLSSQENLPVALMFLYNQYKPNLLR